MSARNTTSPASWLGCARVCAVLWGFLAVAAHAAPPIATGSYADAMLIGYDPASGTLSGYFDMQRGDPPMFSCIFYLTGKLSGSGATIRTYFPQTPKDELISGTLKLQNPKAFRVALKSEHGGCANVESFADKDQPADFQLDTAYPWTSVRVVKAAKAYFYPSPAAAAHGRAYIVQGDGVGVRAAQTGWLQVDYVGGDKPVSGWLKASDLYPAGP
jgi:hypothetical protein